MRKTLTAVVLALALAGCTGQEKENQASYPREAKENFVDTCASAAKRAEPQAEDKDLRDRCQCVVDELEKRLDYRAEGPNNDFTDFDRLARDQAEVPTALQEDVDQATATCAD